MKLNDKYIIFQTIATDFAFIWRPVLSQTILKCDISNQAGPQYLAIKRTYTAL